MPEESLPVRVEALTEEMKKLKNFLDVSPAMLGPAAAADGKRGEAAGMPASREKWGSQRPIGQPLNYLGEALSFC